MILTRSYELIIMAALPSHSTSLYPVASTTAQVTDGITNGGWTGPRSRGELLVHELKEYMELSLQASYLCLRGQARSPRIFLFLETPVRHRATLRGCCSDHQDGLHSYLQYGED